MGDDLKRYLVCGGRDFCDKTFMYTKLAVLLQTDWMFILVHGDAPGADTMAAEWANNIGLIVESHPADWKTHGRSAGPIRNQEMLDSGIDGVVAFPGGNGTADMVHRATEAGVPVWDLRNAGSAVNYQTDQNLIGAC
jgi:hypothetical protein